MKDTPPSVGRPGPTVAAVEIHAAACITIEVVSVRSMVYDLLVYAHIFGGGASLLLCAGVALAPKGDARHVRLARPYRRCLWATALTGLAIALTWTMWPAIKIEASEAVDSATLRAALREHGLFFGLLATMALDSIVQSHCAAHSMRSPPANAGHPRIRRLQAALAGLAVTVATVGWLRERALFVVLGALALWSAIDGLRFWTRTRRPALGQWRRRHIDASIGGASESSALRARLEALQLRCQPHFSFNGLNAIAGLVEEGDPRAAHAVDDLAEVLRHVLEGSRDQRCRLAHELGIIDADLAIERLRFEDRLTIERDVDPRLAEAQVLPLCLQALVENCVRHGLAGPHGRTHLHLCARADGQSLELVVRNRCDVPSHVPNPGTGFGLSDLRERLVLAFGDRATVTTRNTAGVFTIRLRFPLELSDPP